jgi:hypothetical protein
MQIPDRIERSGNCEFFDAASYGGALEDDLG